MMVTSALAHSASTTPIQPPAVDMPRIGVRNGETALGMRLLAEECPVALTFNGSTYAVMMASPADLEDFARGFALTEGIVDDAEALRELEVVAHGEGYEVRAWVPSAAEARLAARRRRLIGPVGCGLCGIESLEEAARSPMLVPDHPRRVAHAEIGAALEAVEREQNLNRGTRSHHAAALWSEGRLLLREDVGRHNALDKLAGALIRSPMPLAGAMVLITSRASVDLVQKVTRLGASILVAVSAPTALAVRSAAASGLTLVGVARRDGFEIYSRPDRIA